MLERTHSAPFALFVSILHIDLKLICLYTYAHTHIYISTLLYGINKYIYLSLHNYMYYEKALYLYKVIPKTEWDIVKKPQNLMVLRAILREELWPKSHHI